MSSAFENLVASNFAKMLETGRYIPPEPLDELHTGLKMAHDAYVIWRTNNAPEDRLSLLRNYIIDSEHLISASLGVAPTPPPPGAMMLPIARLGYSSNVASSRVSVLDSSNLTAGMRIELSPSPAPEYQRRACSARIQSINGLEIEFEHPLGVLIPAAAAGDYLFLSAPTLEERVAKIEMMFEGVCTEHDDCKASLLSHACKESQRQSEEKK